MSLDPDYHPGVYRVLESLAAYHGVPWDRKDCRLWLAICEKDELVERTREGMSPEQDGFVYDITDYGLAILKMRDEPPPTQETPIYHGNGKLQIGKQWLTLEPTRAAALGALVKLRTATTEELKRESKLDDPGRELRRLIKQFPVLHSHIKTPGTKGKGGYSTTIRAEP